jgi:hypothetical protein
VLAAGFNEGTSIDDVVENSSNEIQQKRTLVSQLEGLNDQAISYSIEKQKEAADLTAQAERMMNGVDKSDTEAYVKTLVDYMNLISQAKKLNDEAQVAYDAVMYNKAYIDRTRNFLALVEDNLSNVKTAAEEKNFDAAVESLRWEKDRINNGDTLTTSKEDVLDLAQAMEFEQQDILNRISRLREEENSFETDVKRINKSLANTTKSKDKLKLENELSQVDEELVVTREKIRTNTARADKLGHRENLYRDEAQFIDQMADGAGFLSKYTAEARTDQQIEEIGNTLTATYNRLGVLEIDDEETLALIGEEQRRTRNDISDVAIITTAAADIDFDLKPVKNLRDDYDDEVTNLTSIDPAADQYRKHVLMTTTIQEVENQVAFLKEVQSYEMTESEKQILSDEISSLEMFADEMTSTLVEKPQVSSTPYTDADLTAVYSELVPDFEDKVEAADLGENDLERAEGLLEAKREVESVLSNLIAQSEKDILRTSDPIEVNNLLNSNEKNRQALALLDRKYGDVSMIIGAYESDNKAIIESERNYAEKLEDQIDLTERYLFALEDAEVAVNKAAEESADSKRQKRLLDIVGQLQTAFTEGNQKLEGYKSDLELSLSTASEPADDVTEPSGEELASDTRSDEILPNEVIITEPLPEKQSDVILTLEPGYSREYAEVVLNYATEEERRVEKIRLNNNLITSVENEIQLRATQIEQSSNVNDQDRLQREIQDLEALSTLKTEENNRLSEGMVADDLVLTDTTEDSTIETDDLLLDTEIETPVEIVEVEFLTEDNVYSDGGQLKIRNMINIPDPESPLVAYENDSFKELLQSDPENRIGEEDLLEMSQIKEDIAVMEAEIQMVESRGQQKKLDKKIENGYFDLSKKEIDVARKVRELAVWQYENNVVEIESLIEENQSILDEHDYLKKRIERLLSSAEINMDDAATKRIEAGPIMDEIRQGYVYREASTLEQNALRNHDQIFDIFESLDILTQPSDEVLSAIVRGEYNEELLADIEDSENTEETSTEDLTTEVKVLELNETESELLGSMETPFEVSTTINSEIRDADVVDRNNMKQMLTADYGLNDEGILEFTNNAEVSGYLKASDELNNLINERNAQFSERETKSAELSGMNNEMAKLRAAAIDTDNRAERQGLIEQMQQIYQIAEVIYQRIQELDQSITSLDQQIDDQSAELAIQYDNLDIDQIIVEQTEEVVLFDSEMTPETEDVTEDLTTLETTNDNEVVTGSTEVDAETAIETVDSGALPSDARKAFVMPSSPEDFIGFEFPDVLENEIFVRLEKGAYSESNPIPMDVDLPEGVVFKVQVGAFRNPIPQDHFREFAPMSGEQLNNGITRYTAGLFRTFNTADFAKVEIRGIGYSDAFVVAFKDGVRIPLYEARALTGEELIAERTGPANSDTNSSAGSEPASESTNGSGSSDNNDSGTNSGNSGNSRNSNSGIDSETERSYYSENPDVIKANRVEETSGMFFTVQIGVYTKPVSGSSLYNLNPVNSELTSTGKVRYTTGMFNNIVEASVKKEEIKQLGISDAFVTAYNNGKRITLKEASTILATGGVGTLKVTSTQKEAPATGNLKYDVWIGTFSSQVPSEVAQAILLLEDKWGILQSKRGEETSYFTARVDSKEIANLIKADFANMGVDNVSIRTFNNGVEIGTE